MKRSSWMIVGGLVAVCVVGAAGASLLRKSPPPNPLAGLTLEQVTARIKDCGAVGRDFKEKSAGGTASDADRASFEDCRLFMKNAMSYMQGPIVIDRENGRLKWVGAP